MKRTELNPPTVALTLGFDSPFARHEGGSVRYLVADLVADLPVGQPAGTMPVHLALAIDVSGSMAGAKLQAACETAWPRSPRRSDRATA